MELIEIGWYYRPGDPTSYDSEIGILIGRNGQDYIIRSIKDGRTYNGDILVRTIRQANPDPFLQMPDDYVKCPACGLYRQIDADDNVMPCSNCGDGE